MIMGNYVCARPVHPGEILKEEIEYRGISQVKLAAQMGMSYKELNHILNERRPLTPTTAMLIEAALHKYAGRQPWFDNRLNMKKGCAFAHSPLFSRYLYLFFIASPDFGLSSGCVAFRRG
jgi:addiction module HigA family antidote